MKARNPGLIALALATAMLAACATNDDGNRVDEAVEATGDAVDSAVDATSDAVDEVAESATWQRIEGNWKQFTGAAKERWGELTDDEVDEIDGNREQLVGKVQEKYGIARAEAEEQVDEWADGQS